MILFFRTAEKNVIAVEVNKDFNKEADTNKLEWLFSEAESLKDEKLEGVFIGPRREMVTPWSPNNSTAGRGLSPDRA